MLHGAAPSLGAAPAAPRRGAAGGRCSVVCMAHPRRVVKVAKQIEREIGQLLVTDKVLSAAVRGGALASVTDVELSPDLAVARVYTSVYGGAAADGAAALAALRRLEPYVRGRVGRAVRLRSTPEIRFVADESLERADRVQAALRRGAAIAAGEAEPPPIAIADDRYTLGAAGDSDEDSDGDEFFDGDGEEGEGDEGFDPKAGRGPAARDAEFEEMLAAFRAQAAGRAAGGGGGGGGGKRRPQR